MRKRAGGSQAILVGVALVYFAIAVAVPLLHQDDCPAAPGSKTAGNTLPSNAPCPACKFLANSHSDQIPYEATPDLVQSRILPDFGRHSLAIVTSPGEGSILLRGPPLPPLS
jgi:hypothetical protein